MPTHGALERDLEGPKEACGVVGVFAPGQPVSHLTYLALYALQHRGQEAAGMAVSDGQQLTVVKDQGLVSNAFDDRTLADPPRAPVDRAHPLLDDRLVHVAQRPAGVAVRSAAGSSPSATTAT